MGLRDTGDESNEAVPLTTFDRVTLFVFETLLSESEAFDDKFAVLDEDSFCKTKSKAGMNIYIYILDTDNLVHTLISLTHCTAHIELVNEFLI